MLFSFFKKKTIQEGLNTYKSTPGAILLDVRTPQEYKTGHLPSALNIPLDRIALVQKRIYEKNTPIFVYCQSGARSAHAKRLLEELGYEKVTNIGGLTSMQTR